MKQVIEAEWLDKDRWPARQLASLIDGWKNRGLSPSKVPASESYGFAGGKGEALYAAYPEAFEGTQMLPTSRSPSRKPAPLHREPRRFSRNTTAASATFWSTSIRHQHRPIPLAEALGARLPERLLCGRRRISRSTAGAAPKWTTSSASKPTSRAPRVIRLERNLSLDGTHPGSCSRPHRPQTRAASARRFTPMAKRASASRFGRLG